MSQLRKTLKCKSVPSAPERMELTDPNPISEFKKLRRSGALRDGDAFTLEVAKEEFGWPRHRFFFELDSADAAEAILAKFGTIALRHGSITA